MECGYKGNHNDGRCGQNKTLLKSNHHHTLQSNLFIRTKFIKDLST